MILTEHMIMISIRGINPESTPTLRKIEMLSNFRNFGLVCFVFIMFSTMFYTYDEFSGWVSYLAASVFGLSIDISIAYYCRLRNAMTTTYDEDADMYEVNEDEELKNWTPGVPLPPIPTGISSLQKVYPSEQN